jgi:hypothetical protein
MVAGNRYLFSQTRCDLPTGQRAAIASSPQQLLEVALHCRCIIRSSQTIQQPLAEPLVIVEPSTWAVSFAVKILDPKNCDIKPAKVTVWLAAGPDHQSVH